MKIHLQDLQVLGGRGENLEKKTQVSKHKDYFTSMFTLKNMKTVCSF